MIFLYNSLYTQAVAYATYFELGEPVVCDQASYTLILMFVDAFSERGVFTHLFRLIICVRLIISVHDYFTAVTVRHEASRIVTVRAILATRLGSSDPPTFSGVGIHYLKFTSAISFSRHDFRCDGRDDR